MKKTISVLALLAFFVTSMSSCKKEYDCTCRVTLSDGTVNEYSTNIYAKKKDKQKECEASAPDSDFGKTCTVN
jgi:hypothetical protein